MSNTINTTIVTKKVNDAIAANAEITTGVNKLIELVARVNAVKLGDKLTDAEIKAGGIDTIASSIDNLIDKVNHQLRKAVYAVCYDIQQDVLPALLLDGITQYVIKRGTTEEHPDIIQLALESKVVPVSVKSYDAWVKKEHGSHIVQDVTYFAKADTLAYYLLQGVAEDVGCTITNYRFTYGLNQDIKRANLVGAKASNTKIVEELQKVLDALLFVPREDGKNQYRCISKDASFLKNIIVSAGKGRLELKAMKAGAFLARVEAVMFRIAAEKSYSVSYATAKAK